MLTPDGSKLHWALRVIHYVLALPNSHFLFLPVHERVLRRHFKQMVMNALLEALGDPRTLAYFMQYATKDTERGEGYS